MPFGSGSRATCGSVICVHCGHFGDERCRTQLSAPDRWGAHIGSGRRRLISLNRVPLVTVMLPPAVDVAARRAVPLLQDNAGTETSYGDPLHAVLVDKDGCGAQG